MVRFLLERGADVDGDDGSTPLWIACQNDCADAARACLDHGADVNRVDERGCSPLQVASQFGYVDPARLCLERGADINQMTPSAGINSFSPRACANIYGHEAMAAWLARVERDGWTRHLSETRYKLVVLREIAARGRARREHAFDGKELVLDFLFPGAGQPPSRGNKQARRQRARLPDERFSIIRALLLGRRPAGRGGGRCRRRGRGPGRRGAGVESRDERPLPPYTLLHVLGQRTVAEFAA